VKRSQGLFQGPPRIHFHFPKNRLQVVFDGVFGQKERLGDLAIALAFGGSAGDFVFAKGEASGDPFDPASLEESFFSPGETVFQGQDGGALFFPRPGEGPP